MRTFSLSILLVLMVFSAIAQQEVKLKFEEQTHDFGTIKEENGPVTHEFRFKNQSNKPVTISNVQASCGCTTPGWTKEPVAPGEEGFVKAQYNTTNRPGSFYKSLTVHTDQKDVVKLYIKGNVVPRPKSIEEQLPTANGNLRTKYSSFNMGKILTTENPTVKEFDVYNAGEEPLIIKRIVKPDHVMVSVPDTLQPGKAELMAVTYDAIAKNDLGFFSENLTIVTDEPFDSVKSYTLYTNVEEYFPPMSKEEFNKTARLSFGEQVYDFNRAKEGDQVVNEFQLTNNGQSTLNIRKVDSNCSCLIAELSKNDLKPGETAIIKAVLSTEGRNGNQQKAITVYSNDPSAPVQRLTVKGYVEAKE